MDLLSDKRVIAYVRVSTDNQLDNYSIEEQSDRINAYCKAKGLILVKIYTDGGYSGGNMNRPALQQMLNDINNNLVEIVIVYKLDRLSRSQKDTLMLIEDTFLTNNVDFISISENFDTSTPFGRAMIGILSVFAQLEKDQITERFTMGRIGRAKSGYFHGGPTAPTGYDYVSGNLVVNEYEALQVKEVFKQFMEGQSVNAIKRYMSNNYTNKYGNWSSHSLVLNILRNEVYIGKIKFKKISYKGNHQPIISEFDFNQVQNLLTDQKRYDKNPVTKTPFRAGNLLTSIVFCKKCGARYFGNHGKYSCYSRAKTNRIKVLDPNCRNKHWRIEELDKRVIAAITELSFNDNFFNSLTKNRHVEVVPDKTKLLNRIREIDKQISRMIDLYQVGNLSLEEINERTAKLNDEKARIEEESDKEKPAKLTLVQAEELLGRVRDIFENGGVPQQRLLINTLVERIEVDDDNIDIYWSFI